MFGGHRIFWEWLCLRAAACEALEDWLGANLEKENLVTSVGLDGMKAFLVFDVWILLWPQLEGALVLEVKF